MTIDPSIRTSPDSRPYWCLSLLVSFALLSAVVAIFDLPALLVTLALPAIPSALFAIIKGMTGHKTYGALLSIIVIFVLAANFRNRAYADKDIDFASAPVTDPATPRAAPSL